MQRASLLLIFLVAWRVCPAAAADIPLEILEPADRGVTIDRFPVSAGVVFAPGELPAAPGGAILDDLGRSIPFESQVTAWWSPEKKSVRWLLVHFPASTARKYVFRLAAPPQTLQGRPIASSSSQGISVDTGPLRVKLSATRPTLLDEAILNGQAMIEPGQALFDWADDEGRPLECSSWKLTLAESTPSRATAKAEAFVKLPGAQPLARLSVRYRFFAGESFVRLDHTLTWWPRSLDPGAGRIALRIKPRVKGAATARIGLSDYSDQQHAAAMDSPDPLVACQDDCEHFSIRQGARTLREGKHLGGWMALEDHSFSGIGVALKNVWQLHPKSLAVRDGALEVGLWPREAGRLSCEERDIMPEPFWYSPHWKAYDWTRNGGFSPLAVKDVLPGRAEALIGTLRSQSQAAAPSPGKRIVDRLRPEVRARITACRPGEPVPDAFVARVVHNLNDLLKARDLYDAAAWSGVRLKPKAKELLAKGPPALEQEELVWFNRLLLESAFPSDLAPTDVTHFIHEAVGKWKAPTFLHTGEGAARTDELVISFYDRTTGRPTAQLNSLLQHPIAIRQSPASALRVAHEGFRLPPLDHQRYPDMERAIETLARTAVARWPATYDYGFWRYGMTRWGGMGVGYRWFDGLQYDIQLIPWIMFLRGGGRHWYEEGLATARFAMDVATNHHNTRGAPTGYAAMATGMPFPAYTSHMCKGSKLHYLAYCSHLTGDLRAGEVMQEVIAGVRKAAIDAPLTTPPEYRRGWARELYNMNLFWADAYEETWDARIRGFAGEWRQLSTGREYHPALNVFRDPQVYLYQGLVRQHALSGDERLRAVMLRHLAGEGFPGLEDGGVYRVEDAIACPWAYEQTQDRRFARIAWDVARTLADLVPEGEVDKASGRGYPVLGHQFWRHYLLPILTGCWLAAKEGLDQATPYLMRDTFVGLQLHRGGSRGTVFLKPHRAGDLRVRILAVGPGESPAPALRLAAYDHAARQVAGAEIPFTPRYVIKDTERCHPNDYFIDRHGQLTIPGAAAGTVYRLEIEAAGPQPPIVLVLTDAQCVHQIPPGQLTQFYNLAGQYHVGARIFTRIAAPAIKIVNSSGKPYTIRDARTQALLFRSKLGEPLAIEHRLSTGRAIMIVQPGRASPMSFTGCTPYVSATAEGYFEP